ncbi:lytic transglycosylase domain-containing protein [Candidatus Acidulodesulfobacterium sp. H_13]|uniref:lytic transglycosylase domain-containing protein n=1 Tax=Candidatus Acidulodesulfobacterium sp. H_13 TaxID=3395470 RepID=UPI003AF71FE9
MHKFFTAIILTFIASALFNLKPSYSINFVNLLKINNYPSINYSNEIYFKNAYKDYKHGNYKRAAGLFWLYTVKGRLLRGYALYYEGICLLKLKEYRKAKYVLSKLIGSDGGAFFHENAVFYLAISEGGSGYPYSEISNLKYVTRYSLKQGLRSRSMFKIYEVYHKLKEYARANKYLLKTYIDYPLFSKKHNIRFKTASLTEPQKIRRGINLYYGSYYSESLSVLRKAGDHGENDINRRMRFIILKDLAGIKSPLFLKDVKSCLNSDNDITCYRYYGVKRSELLNLEAYYYYRTLHDSQKAIDIFNNTARKYGYLNKDAMNAYKTVVWSMVLNNLKNGRLVNAAKVLKSFFIVDDAVNESTTKFLFWYGVILKKLGFVHEASFYFNIIRGSKLLRYSYYGVMSVVMIDGSREGIRYDRAYGISDSGNKFADMAFKYMPALRIYLKKNQELNIKFKRLKAFLNLKLYHLANISTRGFISELRKQRFRKVKHDAAKTGTYPVYSVEKLAVPVVYMLYKTRNYEAAISLASNLIYNFRYRFLLLNKRFLTVLYPRPYYNYVHRYSVSYGVQANLIYAIMRQESLYDPTSYSSADAIGLMQIIPPTGYYIAKRVGRYDFNPAMLYKKNVNINFGSYYLKILLNRFNNRKYLAIASYNAGPLAVAYWKNNLPKKYDPSLFIELIPVKQTRHYVKAVLANYYIYNLIYGHY